MSNISGVLQSHRPLADRMRPRNLAEYLGQEELIGTGKALRNIIQSDHIPSMILWGPPGSGKTTLARIIAGETQSEFLALSAVGSGVKDVRGVVERAKQSLLHGRRTILFLDEIHRFNKSQQDAFLPHVEDGTIILIGATTENPSFEINSALLSRCRVFVLQALSEKNIEILLNRTLVDQERGLGSFFIECQEGVLSFLAIMSNGDARTALNALEIASSAFAKNEKKILLKKEDIAQALQRTHILYDKKGEEHYNIISALHKSMRGGDANAALYWLGRMLEGGEDPLYVARRLIRFASEDVGIANSQALLQAVAAYQACHVIGMPECSVNLAQAVVYMALSQKSNALYAAYGEVKRDIERLPNEGVPLHLRNAPTKLMRDLEYGKGYKYTPDYVIPEEAKQEYLPEKLRGKKYIEQFFLKKK